MTRDEANANVRAAFEGVARPESFRRGTCGCEECEEHNETMKAHTPGTISLKEVGNAAWDPMCMASDAAFAYFLPGLVRLACETPWYSDQLLFHLNSPGRVEYLNPHQAAALKEALWLLIETAPGEVDLQLADEAIRRLERLVNGLPPSEHA